MFCRSMFVLFRLFFFAHCLSILLWFTVSDYPWYLQTFSWLQELRNDYALKFNFDSWWILTSNRKKSLKIPRVIRNCKSKKNRQTMGKKKKPEKDKHRSYYFLLSLITLEQYNGKSSKPKIFSRHDIAEIFLKLLLNNKQSIKIQRLVSL
jgi:hypothetical protein